ncbi:polysaccharide biosynthesis protein [Dyella monticola]|uniref:Polysaccharide biosynthesis protein n=1 Tax=Dyella monticola TaxID=1927958 RepID=A0A370WZZ0_9GAMM|nr:oligosaccharide flippase family protein [Dyella monticola]RDS81666.1 polysaccharide biosynthesis protein [Dyella monticola]
MNAIGLRLALRVGALALKFALTMIIARTLGFDAVAAYGFAVAASVVASKVLGLGFSTELNRQLSDDTPADAIRTAKRLFALYGTVYALLCLLMAASGLVSGPWRVSALPTTPLWLIALVACAEHAALEVNSYVYALHRTHAATWLLFVRTGAWAGVAIAALMLHAIGSIEALFAIWLVTNVGVVVAGWTLMNRVARGLPPSRARVIAPAGLAKVWVDGVPFFVALLLLSILQYLERFVAAGVLTANELGRYVFVWSIANAIQTVAAATVVFAAGPRLVRAAAGSDDAFRRELLHAAAASLLLSGAAAIGLFALRVPIFQLAHGGGGAWQTNELSLLGLSFVLRALTDVLWAAAVAQRKGRPVAISMALLALICLPVSIMLVRSLDGLGAACAHLVASVAVAVTMVWIIASRASPALRLPRGAADAA